MKDNRTKSLVAGFLALSGCVAMAPRTTTVLSSNVSSIVIEYNKGQPTEYEAATQTAQIYCTQYGKNAQAVKTVDSQGSPLDREVTTFNCV